MTFKDLFWPGFLWFVKPSGGPWDSTLPWWRKVWRVLYDAPLFSHPGGMVLATTITYLLGGRTILLLAGVDAGWALLNQFHKALRERAYGKLWPRELAYRFSLDAVGIRLGVWLWLGQ